LSIYPANQTGELRSLTDYQGGQQQLCRTESY
jgi:hypothetical protein